MRARPSLGTNDVVASFDGPLGAYLHVPFCDWICPFCPYNKVLAEDALAQRYFAALQHEVRSYVLALGRERDFAFTSLYIGGGTPTLYLDALAEVLAQIPVSAERAIEVLPTHATPKRLARLRAMEITSVSIGAQSFHDAVLQRLGRPHDATASRSAVTNALGQFDCVDVDLIVDVAWEADETIAGAFLDDLRTCFSLGVDQVSTYPLMRFGYTPFGAARHDRRREHDILAQASELAAMMGYARNSVWSFRRQDGRPYTSITRRRFLGMGAGSSSFAGRDFYVNHFGLATYIDAVEHDRLPIARWLHLGRAAGALYELFWQSYTGTVDLGCLRQPYGAVLADLATATFSLLARTGLVAAAPGGFRLTPRGFSLYHDLEELVTYQLIEPLWAEMLAEHELEGTPAGQPQPSSWARLERQRPHRAWSAVRRLFERAPLRTSA